jgi:S-adenosylmethionine synthetase
MHFAHTVTHCLPRLCRNRELPSILQFSSEDCMTKWKICQTFADIMGLPLDNMVPYKPSDEPNDGTVRPYDCHLDTSALQELGIYVRTVDFRTWWLVQMRDQTLHGLLIS